MATLLTPGSLTPRRVDPAHGPAFRLDEIQQLVGGYIEALRIADDQWLVINEDGKRLQLPVNHLACQLVGHLLLPGDFIVGPAVLCTTTEMDGDDSALAADARDDPDAER